MKEYVVRGIGKCDYVFDNFEDAKLFCLFKSKGYVFSRTKINPKEISVFGNNPPQQASDILYVGETDYMKRKLLKGNKRR